MLEPKRYDIPGANESDDGCYIKYSVYELAKQSEMRARNAEASAKFELAQWKESEEGSRAIMISRLENIIDHLKEKLGIDHPIDFEKYCQLNGL